MKSATIVLVCVGYFAVFVRAAGPSTDAKKYWPQWRGPTASGASDQGRPPLEWSESDNVRWKVPIPGRGHATPIIWGDRIYVQTAVKTDREVAIKPPAEKPPDQKPGRRRRGGHNWMGSAEPTHIHAFTMLALDRHTGKTVWTSTLCEELPHESGHRDASHASNSPVTDGEHIFAHFGSRGLYCLDLEGKIVWKKNFGKMQTRRSFGEGSSPVLHGNTVIVNWDHEGQSFIVALDKKTGKERWKVDRDEPTSWATPLIVEVDGKPQVVTSATNLIRSYDLDTGNLIWQCGGMTLNVIPSPVSGSGLLYVTSGFRGNILQAIRYAEAKGDITDSAVVAWKYDGKGTPYVPSPLLYGDVLYLLDHNRAMLSCFDAKTGKQHYIKKRLGGLEGAYASPVGAADRVYVVSRGGKTAVVSHGPTFGLLATNTLDDDFAASPAIAGDAIYLRGDKYLYCIAED